MNDKSSRPSPVRPLVVKVPYQIPATGVTVTLVGRAADTEDVQFQVPLPQLPATQGQNHVELVLHQ